MEKIFFLFLALALTKMVAGVAFTEKGKKIDRWEFEEGMAAQIGRERKVEDEVSEEDSGFEFPGWRSDGVGRIPVNVEAFGAIGDGITDDTQVSLSLSLKS